MEHAYEIWLREGRSAGDARTPRSSLGGVLGAGITADPSRSQAAALSSALAA
jgi:hypothetical protein